MAFDLSSLPVLVQGTVKPEYIDEMGHMNVMWYTQLVDKASFELMKRFGFDEAYFKKYNAGCFAITSHYQYIAELRLGQAFTVRTRALGRSEKRFHFMHFITNDDNKGRLSTTVEKLAIHIDMGSRRSSPMNQELKDGFDRLLGEHSQLTWAAPVCGSIRP